MFYLKKIKTLAAGLSIFLSVCMLSAQDVAPESAQTEELKKLPPVLRDGFYTYLKSGPNQAAIFLKKHYSPSRDQDKFSRGFRDRIRDLTQDSGDLIKIEVINERQVTTSLRTYYLLFGYEEGIVIARFDMYAGLEGLQIVGFNLSKDLSKALPSYTETVQ